MKPMKFMLAASLVCGTALFYGCSDDSSSTNPDDARFKSPKQAEFVRSTRANLKDAAENLNFASWKVANRLNTEFNEHVLTNPEFDKGISTLFSQQIQKSIKTVEKGGELAKSGYTHYATVDLSKLKYSFSVNKNRDGFDIEKADNFELVLPGVNPENNKKVDELFKVSIKQSGSNTKIVKKNRIPSDTAVVILVPEKISFSIDSKMSGSWETLYSGNFKNEIKLAKGVEYGSLTNSTFNIKGEVKSTLAGNEKKGLPGDATTLTVALGQNPSTHLANVEFGFVHNDKKIVELSTELKNSDGMTDLSMLTSSNSIIDLFGAVMSGNSVEDQKMTILEDLVISLTVKDCDKMLALQHESASMRRNYASEADIKKYADKMNNLMELSLESKSTNQKIAVKLGAVEFGVDYWTMPMLKFSDYDEYVSLLEVLDQEAMEYGINILDHAIDPMKESIVVARQLLQYFQTLMGIYLVEQAQ